MTIFKEKEKIEEKGRMVLSSDTDNLPFKVAIQSPDHEPAHAHVLDKDIKKEIGQFLITAVKPKTPLDIHDFNIGITDDMRKQIFTWSRQHNKFLSKISNWESLMMFAKVNANSTKNN
jgi:hypothetical protein